MQSYFLNKCIGLQLLLNILHVHVTVFYRTTRKNEAPQLKVQMKNISWTVTTNVHKNFVYIIFQSNLFHHAFTNVERTIGMAYCRYMFQTLYV